MLLDIGSGGNFFGDAPLWVFPLVGIPMMLIMIGGMGLMMWFMMQMMMGMGSHGVSHEPDDVRHKPTADRGSEAEITSLRREVETLRSRLAALEDEPALRSHADERATIPSQELEGSGGDEPRSRNG